MATEKIALGSTFGESVLETFADSISVLGAGFIGAMITGV